MLTFIDFETGDHEWLVDFAIWTVHRRISTRRQICICPRADLNTYDGPICIARMMSFRNNFRGIRKSHLQHSASFSSKIYSGKETMFWLCHSFFKACSTIGIRNITKSSVYVFFFLSPRELTHVLFCSNLTLVPVGEVLRIAWGGVGEGQGVDYLKWYVPLSFSRTRTRKSLHLPF